MGNVAQSSSVAPNPPLNPVSLTSTRMFSTPQVVYQQTFANPHLVPPPTFASRFPSPPSFFHGPAMPAAASALPPFVSAHNYGTPQPTSMPFPSSIMAPPLYSSGSPSSTALPHGANHPSRAYTPDVSIHTLGNQNTTMNRSGAKPPGMKAPSFDGDSRDWPMFIQMFKVFVHDTVSSDAERIAHLYDALTPAIRKDIGGALLNPGLYQHALCELHKRYGNPQIISQACTSSLLKLQLFRDNDFKALRGFSADLHSVVATLRLGGYGMELHSHATLSQLVSKLPPALKSRWGEKSLSIKPHLSTVEDLDQWLDGVAMAEHSIRAVSTEVHQPKIQSKPNDSRHRSPTSHNIFNTTTDKSTEQKISKCPGCKSTHSHHLKDCRQFKTVSVESYYREGMQRLF
ncbi:Uncharacterized protein APZ42_005806, partial [Daphnia magna]